MKKWSLLAASLCVLWALFVIVWVHTTEPKFSGYVISKDGNKIVVAETTKSEALELIHHTKQLDMRERYSVDIVTVWNPYRPLTLSPGDKVAVWYVHNVNDMKPLHVTASRIKIVSE
ncbi:YobA family protein [Paenibacillus sp. P26]|nr:YobA family protein [Paenibacillus sp. P26]